ncbi:MAG: TonB family protein [Mucilaginibacter sp.]|nr:TonB family protein [Mucilaginibacter sp.]
MKLFLILAFILSANCLFAQQSNEKIITKDTINLRGLIYGVDGKPATGIFIESTQLDLEHNAYPIYTQTDTNGYFELKGAKPLDTLRILNPGYRIDAQYMNRGSRYMVIYLPPAKVYDLNSQNPIEVKALRKYPKLTQNFKTSIDIFSGCILSIDQIAVFPGDKNNFINYIQKRLNYPEAAILHSVEGTVEIAFTVERDGSLKDFKILKGIGYDCEQQLIRILKNSPKWRPEIVAGRPSISYQTVSVKFSLTDN